MPWPYIADTCVYILLMLMNLQLEAVNKEVAELRAEYIEYQDTKNQECAAVLNHCPKIARPTHPI